MEHERLNFEAAKKEAEQVQGLAGGQASKEEYETAANILEADTEQRELRDLEFNLSGLNTLHENNTFIVDLGKKLITSEKIKNAAQENDKRKFRLSIAQTLGELAKEKQGELVSQVGGIKGYLNLLVGKPQHAQNPKEIRATEEKISKAEEESRQFKIFHDRGLKFLQEKLSDDLTAMVETPEDLTDALAFSLDAMEEEYRKTETRVQELRDPTRAEWRRELEEKKRVMRHARVVEEAKTKFVETESKRHEQEEVHRYRELRERRSVNFIRSLQDAAERDKTLDVWLSSEHILRKEDLEDDATWKKNWEHVEWENKEILLGRRHFYLHKEEKSYLRRDELPLPERSIEKLRGLSISGATQAILGGLVGGPEKLNHVFDLDRARVGSQKINSFPFLYFLYDVGGDPGKGPGGLMGGHTTLPEVTLDFRTNKMHLLVSPEFAGKWIGTKGRNVQAMKNLVHSIGWDMEITATENGDWGNVTMVSRKK